MNWPVAATFEEPLLIPRWQTNDLNSEKQIDEQFSVWQFLVNLCRVWTFANWKIWFIKPL